MKIYITHCSAQKNDLVKGSAVPPDVLYTSSKIQGFINNCKKLNVEWAIFSDLYGVIFSYEQIEWYDKHPNKVTETEYQQLLSEFDEKLRNYSEIWFYHHPKYFHKIYKRILDETTLKNKLHTFTHIYEIT
ncbi:DUF6884 domain-containing protein [Cohnella fermenti]|uniref:DUF6884 domain-containing protein n=1 Tax=Cohnella fermenti TaxID=2565925 RepID=A0A4S4BIC9_9BACL|nr:DUF6884 domain-containing protein [Cohnella fermenti]THF74356.1 hypothetical protein E6C55_25265 [Cohnella fermenti]